MRAALAVLFSAAPAFVSPAFASSDDAWEEFRAEVHTACAALAEGAVVEVNPFGSERFGAAIVTVAAGTGVERMVCIFDKQAKTAEITGPFGS